LNGTVFDKLVIETEQRLNEEAYNALLKTHKEQMGYSPIVGGKFGERITFQTPDNPFTLVFGDHHTKLDLNPNKYGSYEKCLHLLKNLIHDFDPEQTTIKRIDLNVDLGLNYDVVVESIVVSNVRKCIIELFSSMRTKLKLGEKKSQFCIYNKSYFERRPDIAWTRIEKRFISGKCPIKNLSQIHELTSLHPFEAVSFYQLSAFEPRNISELIKWCGIRHLILRYGMQYTKRLLSRDGKLKRRRKYLEEVEPFCPDDFYKTNIGNFFGNGIN
jgi:hypothetical protein